TFLPCVMVALENRGRGGPSPPRPYHPNVTRPSERPLAHPWPVLPLSPEPSGCRPAGWLPSAALWPVAVVSFAWLFLRVREWPPAVPPEPVPRFCALPARGPAAERTHGGAAHTHVSGKPGHFPLPGRVRVFGADPRTLPRVRRSLAF